MTCDICGAPANTTWRVRRVVNSEYDVTEWFDAGECCTDELEQAETPSAGVGHADVA